MLLQQVFTWLMWGSLAVRCVFMDTQREKQPFFLGTENKLKGQITGTRSNWISHCSGEAISASIPKLHRRARTSNSAFYCGGLEDVHVCRLDTEEACKHTHTHTCSAVGIGRVYSATEFYSAIHYVTRSLPGIRGRTGEQERGNERNVT